MASEVIEDEQRFYAKAKTYWQEIPPTVDGMLGGYGHISAIDINSSRKFLQRFLRVGRARSKMVVPPGMGIWAWAVGATAGNPGFSLVPSSWDHCWQCSGYPMGFQGANLSLLCARQTFSPLCYHSSPYLFWLPGPHPSDAQG